MLDLAVEQALAPALRRVSESFVQVMLEQGVPIEAIVTELVLSGEVERTYRLVRLEGGAAQMAYHSPTSQYGQMSRAGRYDHLDIVATMRELVDDIASGRFADEWEAERDAGYPRSRGASGQGDGTGDPRLRGRPPDQAGRASRADLRPSKDRSRDGAGSAGRHRGNVINQADRTGARTAPGRPPPAMRDHWDRAGPDGPCPPAGEDETTPEELAISALTQEP